MAFGRLASLLVDIVINTRRFQSQLGTAKKDTEDAAKQMRRSLTSIGLAASGILLVQKAVRLTADTAWASIEAFAKLEKQIIDIQKVANFENVDQFAASFVKLGTSIRGVSFAELGDIGGNLARLGVRGGQQNFTDFLEVIAKFKATTGDLDLRQAGEGLGKLLQNFNKELNATNALRLASSINKLADDFAVTSSEILNITQKLSGLGNTIGLTAEETLGLVTVLKQTGISSEVVASTYTRLFTLLETTPLTVGKALGQTDEELQTFVDNIRVKPIEAIRQFFKSLSEMPVQDAIQVLKELELTTARNEAAFLNAANRFKDFDKAQQTAISGSENVSNLLEKYALTAGTAADKIEQLKNNWQVFLQSLQSGDGILGEIIDKLNFIIKFQLSNNPVNPGERDPLIATQGTPSDRLAQIQARMAEIEKEYKKSVPGGFTSGTFSGEAWRGLVSAMQGLVELGTLGEFESIRNLEEKFAKLAEEEKTLMDMRVDAAVAEQAALTEEKNKRKELQLKRADLEYQSVLESERALKLFNDRVPNLFSEPKIEKRIRDKFEGISKEAKSLIPETMGISTLNIYKQIDALAEFGTQQEISAHYAKQFNDQFKEELDIRIQKLNELENTRMDIIRMIDPGGTAGGIIDRAIRLDNLLKNMSPDFKMNGNLKDLLFKSVFTQPENLQPQIRGLTQAYTDAITDSGQEKIDEAQLKALQDLLEVQIENKELQNKTIQAIKEIETGVI